VILFNHSDSDFQVKVGDRVAQLILERIAIADVEEVEGELTLTSVAHALIGFTGLQMRGAWEQLAMIDSHHAAIPTCISVYVSLSMSPHGLFSVRGEGGFGSTGVSTSSEAAAKRQKLEGETKEN